MVSSKRLIGYGVIIIVASYMTFLMALCMYGIISNVMHRSHVRDILSQWSFLIAQFVIVAMVFPVIIKKIDNDYSRTSIDNKSGDKLIKYIVFQKMNGADLKFFAIKILIAIVLFFWFWKDAMYMNSTLRFGIGLAKMPVVALTNFIPQSAALLYFSIVCREKVNILLVKKSRLKAALWLITGAFPMFTLFPFFAFEPFCSVALLLCYYCFSKSEIFRENIVVQFIAAVVMPCVMIVFSK